MAAGTAPIFYASVHNEAPHTDGDGGAAGALKTQNLNLDGSGTLFTLFTGAANGSGLSYVTIRAAGTNVTTVARFFYYDGTNTNLIDEVTLAPTTASTTAALPPFIWIPPLNVARLQSGHKIKMTLGTTISAGVFATAFGGDY
jgi:hypothetical protein